MSLTQAQVNFGLNMGATHHDGEEYRLKIDGRWRVLNLETKKFEVKSLPKGKQLENLEDYLHHYEDELKEYLKEKGIDESQIDIEELSAIWVQSKFFGKKYIEDKIKGV